jgi:hypothetical protein
MTIRCDLCETITHDNTSCPHQLKKATMSESEVVVEIEQQIYSFLDLCAKYETKPTVLGFAEHLKESYK